MNWEPWTGCYKAAFCRLLSEFKKDGIAQKVNPYKQGSLAKELGINITGDRKLF